MSEAAFHMPGETVLFFQFADMGDLNLGRPAIILDNPGYNNVLTLCLIDPGSPNGWKTLRNVHRANSPYLNNEENARRFGCYETIPMVRKALRKKFEKAEEQELERLEKQEQEQARREQILAEATPEIIRLYAEENKTEAEIAFDLSKEHEINIRFEQVRAVLRQNETLTN